MSLNVAHQYYREPPVASAGSAILRNRCLINTTINRNCRCRRASNRNVICRKTYRQTSGRIVATWKIISRNKLPRVPVSIATERCVFAQKAADFQQVVPRVRPLARPVKWMAFGATSKLQGFYQSSNLSAYRFIPAAHFYDQLEQRYFSANRLVIPLYVNRKRNRIISSFFIPNFFCLYHDAIT